MPVKRVAKFGKFARPSERFPIAENVMIVADAGMGKSTPLHYLLDESQGQPKRVVCCDPALEFNELHHTTERGIPLLSSLSEDALFLDLAARLDRQADPQQLALSFLPKTDNTQKDFFESVPLTLFIAS